MRVLVQRVEKAAVAVNDTSISSIDCGLLLFVGFTHEDTELELDWMARKVVGLRIFEDQAGKMNYSALDLKCSILAVPQFTLYGSCDKGRRPEFLAAASPGKAQLLFEKFCAKLCESSLQVERGAFRQHMHVSLINDGPITIWLEKKPSN